MFFLRKLLALALIAVQAGHAHPQHTTCSLSTAAQPIATAAAAAAAASSQLSRDPSLVPKVVNRFQKQLVQDEKLLSGQALRDVIVLDFNGALPAPGALGGTTKAAVSHASQDVLESS